MRLLRVFAAAAVISAIGAASAAAVDPLPSGFLGAWLGSTTTTPVGPLAHDMPMTITTTPAGEWLMRHDFFNLDTIRGSAQEFWVQPSGSGASATSVLTYCGLLYGFFDVPQAESPVVAPVQVAFIETKRNATYLEWYSNATGTGGSTATGRWWLELSADGNTLWSGLTLPADTATHYQATYTRTSMESLSYVAKHLDRPFPFRPSTQWHFTSPCNFTLKDVAERLSAQHAARQSAGRGAHAASVSASGGAAKATSTKLGCPFGFKSSKKNNQQKETAPQPHTGKQLPRGSGGAPGAGYSYCYRLNPAMNFTVAWDWDTERKVVDVEVSAVLRGSATAQGSYVAFGIYPEWPLMQGMDIVLGYFATDSGAPCVRSMYAKWAVGTPVDDPSQVISNTSLAADAARNRLTMRFTRPFNTGHINIPQGPPAGYQGMPAVAFATGAAGATCAADPGYHFGERGVYGFMFNHDLPEYLRCDAVWPHQQQE